MNTNLWLGVTTEPVLVLTGVNLADMNDLWLWCSRLFFEGEELAPVQTWFDQAGVASGWTSRIPFYFQHFCSTLAETAHGPTGWVLAEGGHILVYIYTHGYLTYVNPNQLFFFVHFFARLQSKTGHVNGQSTMTNANLRLPQMAPKIIYWPKWYVCKWLDNHYIGCSYLLSYIYLYTQVLCPYHPLSLFSSPNVDDCLGGMVITIGTTEIHHDPSQHLGG